MVIKFLKIFNTAVIITLLSFSFLSYARAASSVSLVQSLAGTNNFGGVQDSSAFTSSNTAGDTIVVAIQWYMPSGATTISSVTDTRGNAYTLIPASLKSAGPTADYSNIYTEIAYATNIIAGANTVTVKWASSVQGGFVSIYEIGSSVLDQVSAGAGTSASPSAGTVITTASGDFGFAVALNDDSFGSPNGATAGSGWTIHQNDGGGNSGQTTEYQTQSTAGSLTGNFAARNGTWVASMATFKNSGGGSSDITAPSTPTSLAASAISSSQINLSWTASTDNVGVTGYKIFRGGVQIDTSATNSYSDTGLTGSTNYSYTVSAYDAAGNNSAQSISANATTQAVPSDTTPPSTPTNLSTTAISQSAINLSWTASTDNIAVSGYKVFRGGVQMGTSASPSYSDTGLSASTLYSYTVSAYDAAGNNSLQSANANATTQSGTVGSGNNIYISQSGAGSQDASSCSNAKSVSFFNSVANWGNGTGKIGPGTVVHLCGTITTELQINGSGASGNVVEILWESGAKISLPVGSAISMNSNNYLLFDGGAPCGPNTTCASTDVGTGIIENTANGSSLANRVPDTKAFENTGNSGNIEIRNLIVRDLYQHTSATDVTESADTGTYVILARPMGNLTVHDSTFHDLGTGIRVETTVGSPILNFYNLNIYNDNWGFENSGDGPRTFIAHDIHFGSTTNWDTTSDSFHHNGFHFYMNTPSDSVSTNLYNNLSDGNWGPCCTTATMLFTETDAPNNFNIFNNVVIQSPNNTAPAFEYAATGGVFANNTVIGVAATPQNVEGYQIAGTNLKVENNTAEGYGQYIVAWPGTFTAFDYNQWGALGQSGNDPWAYEPTSDSTFAQWKSSCSCDAHGGNPAHIGVNAAGFPQTGSALIGAGVNLTSLGIAALDVDKNGVARPALGVWDVGAYQFSSGGGGGGDTTPPIVSLISPTNNTIVSSTISVAATASDNVGVSRVEFYLDNALQATDSSSPYNWSWNTSGSLNGSHTLTAKVYDAAGNIGTSASVIVTISNSTPDTTAPTASITSPSAGVVSGSITFSATATDPANGSQIISGIKSVTLSVDGLVFVTSTASSILKTLNTTTLSNGSHILSAQSQDNAGNNSTVASVSVTINNASASKFPRLITLTSFEGIAAVPANQAIIATVVSPLNGTTLETQSNLTPNALKQYTVTFLSSDPQLVNIRIKANGYLSQLISGVDTTVNSGVPLSVPQLSSGDLNNDNTVNALDYSTMNANWLKSGSTIVSGDLNGDGLVNTLDFAILKKNFGKTGQ